MLNGATVLLPPAEFPDIDPLVWVALTREASRRAMSAGRFIELLWRNSGSRPVGDGELTQRLVNNSVRQGECQLWTGALGPSGYGTIRITQPYRGTTGAHRAAWTLTHGPIPKGLFVLHNCDVSYAIGDITYRRCIRVDHLFLGTAADNNADMRAKGRHAFGDRSGTHTHPERVARGERHGTRTHPERIKMGSAHHAAKLSEEDVIVLRKAFAEGKATRKELARLFAISKHHLSGILRRRTWRHI